MLMELLLILLVSFPPQQEDIGDLRFSTKEECLAAGDDLLSGKLIPDWPQINEEVQEKTGAEEFSNPVIRREIQCLEVAKK